MLTKAWQSVLTAVIAQEVTRAPGNHLDQVVRVVRQIDIGLRVGGSAEEFELTRDVRAGAVAKFSPGCLAAVAGISDRAAGACHGAEPGERRMWARHRALLVRREVPTVPAPVLAQAWRGTSRQAQLARLIAGCHIETLDDTRAKATDTIASRASSRDAVTGWLLRLMGDGLLKPFDAARREYLGVRDRLAGLLSASEMAAAARNTLNAHYTDAGLRS